MEITDAFIKLKYAQQQKGYIDFAYGCFNKGDFSNSCEKIVHTSNYKKIKKLIDNKDKKVDFLFKIKDIKYLDVDIVDYQKSEPNQKWHLYISLFCQMLVEDGEDMWNKDFKKYPCIAMKLWLSEACGIDLTVVKKALDNKNEKEAKEIIKNIKWEDIYIRILSG